MYYIVGIHCSIYIDLGYGSTQLQHIIVCKKSRVFLNFSDLDSFIIIVQSMVTLFNYRMYLLDKIYCFVSDVMKFVLYFVTVDNGHDLSQSRNSHSNILIYYLLI